MVETDSGSLEPRFLSRLTPIHFTTYGMKEAATPLLERIWADNAPADMATPDFGRILAESRNNVRASIQVLERELLGVSA